MKYTNLQSSFHSYVLLCQDYCCIVGKFLLLPSQSLLWFVPPSCLAFCHLPQTLYTRQYVVQEYCNIFLTHRSACPISILLCLSIVVDCRVDIESSLSRHSLSANHQLNDILPPIDLHILILNTATFPYGLQYPTVYLLCDAISWLLCILAV